TPTGGSALQRALDPAPRGRIDPAGLPRQARCPLDEAPVELPPLPVSSAQERRVAGQRHVVAAGDGTRQGVRQTPALEIRARRADERKERGESPAGRDPRLLEEPCRLPDERDDVVRREAGGQMIAGSLAGEDREGMRTQGRRETACETPRGRVAVDRD